MDSSVERRLKDLLQLRQNGSRLLKNRENSRIEFKRSFHKNSLAEYAKIMVSFANAEGGYIVFGVENAPRNLIGIDAEQFDANDSCEITRFLNDHCNPELEWEKGTVEFGGVWLGFIYTSESQRKPVMVTKNAADDLREGTIYYRYRAQSTHIRFPELRTMIDELLDRERKMWVQHVSRIASAGAMNVGILDTIQGKLFGKGNTFLIDEALLNQIKFIREGHFEESSGAPTLRLIGEVRSVSGVTADQVVQRGIHFDDLVAAFLTTRPLTEDDAKSLLRESCHQMSPYSPLFYFVCEARLTRDQAVEFIQEAKCGFSATRATIIRRLQGMQSVRAMGVIDTMNAEYSPLSATELKTALLGESSQKSKRSMLRFVLGHSPESVIASLDSVVTVKLALEAVTHLDRPSCVANQTPLKELLLHLFNTKFRELDQTGQSMFRKAIAFLDEQLFGTDNKADG